MRKNPLDHFVDPSIAKNLVRFFFITLYHLSTLFTPKQFTHIRMETEYYLY